MKFDKFYTKEDVAITCVNTLDRIKSITSYDDIIEPSCGGGAFSKLLPPKTISMDIEPEYTGALQLDFYEYKHNGKGHTLVIGNPPFGNVGKEAVRFFNKASEFADTIAFIVPRTFKRISVQNRLDLNFHLIYEKDIPIGSFIPETMKAKCVFQIWEKKSDKRKPVILPDTHSDFKFTSIIDEASIAVKAYGGTGDCGTIERRFDGLNKKAYHFIICSEDVAMNFKYLKYYPLASDTVRQDSIGRKDLVYLYMQYKNEIKGEDA